MTTKSFEMIESIPLKLTERKNILGNRVIFEPEILGLIDDVKESEMRVTTESLKRQHEREIKGLKV